MLVHGYHPAVEDGELYLPGVKKVLNPALYPFNGQFFLSHAHMTVFPNLIATSVRLTHIPFDYAVFLWHFACIFAFLCGCWRVSRACFRHPLAPWGSVALVASLLTIPVAGTALYIMDQYLTPRDLSTAGIMLVLADAVDRRYWRAAILTLLIAAIHPLMAVFGIGLLAIFFFEDRRISPPSAAMLLLPSLAPVSSVYRHILDTSYAYFLVTRWQWYEWLGIFAPLAILWAISRTDDPSGTDDRFVSSVSCSSFPPSPRKPLARSLILFGLLSFAAALILCIPRLAGLTELQPLRSLHLIFILLFVFLGGILAESILKSHAWRWLALLLPICLGMFYAQRQLFPATNHLELPWTAPSNSWAQAFDWVRGNTPADAVFALDPNYMNLPNEDEHGFRELAERSSLANVHDQGGVSMFPALASDWSAQYTAQQNWSAFQLSDFRRLRRAYNVTWVVLEAPVAAALPCPYRNHTVAVCRIDESGERSEPLTPSPLAPSP